MGRVHVRVLGSRLSPPPPSTHSRLSAENVQGLMRTEGKGGEGGGVVVKEVRMGESGVGRLACVGLVRGAGGEIGWSGSGGRLLLRLCFISKYSKEVKRRVSTPSSPREGGEGRCRGSACDSQILQWRLIPGARPGFRRAAALNEIT